VADCASQRVEAVRHTGRPGGRVCPWGRLGARRNGRTGLSRPALVLADGVETHRLWEGSVAGFAGRVTAWPC